MCCSGFSRISQVALGRVYVCECRRWWVLLMLKFSRSRVWCSWRFYSEVLFHFTATPTPSYRPSSTVSTTRTQVSIHQSHTNKSLSQSIARCMSVCLSVSLFVSFLRLPKNCMAELHHFLCMLPYMGVAQSSADAAMCTSGFVDNVTLYS